MDQNSQVTLWIDRLKSGDQEAAQRIWDQFFERVRGLARKKMGNLGRRVSDDEDLALSAMNALCAGAREGKFRKLENRDDLWQLLAMITGRKAANSWRKQSRRQEVGESILGSRQSGDGERMGMNELADREPEEFLDGLSETCCDMLGMLDDRMREVALLRLQGFSNQEIAKQQNRSVKSIERYMKTIREIWQTSESDEPN